MRVCGVNPSLYKRYDFGDHIWSANVAVDPINADLLQLCQRCVKIGKDYLMKKVGGNHWISLSSVTDAEKEALNTWQGIKLPSGTVIDADLISIFFHGKREIYVGKNKVVEKTGSCPNIFQKIVVPLGPQFVVYNNQYYLNIWYDDMIVADAQHLSKGKSLLLMVYGGLCSGTVDKENIVSESERVYQMVINDQYDNDEFKFLMYWLASLYQRPGINLLTNVWLLGTLEGLGKGTLIDVMKNILGHEWVGDLNQGEIEQGWNDHLVGKQLININEFDTDGKMSPRAWGKWIKQHTIEPTFKVKQRNTTSYSVLHIGNFIATSNIETQTFLNEHDRRNQFIKTTDDPWWVQYAAGIHVNLMKQNPEAVGAGFATILDQVKINEDFISRSFKNQFRQTIIKHNPGMIEEWIENDPSLRPDVWRTSNDLYEQFKSWWPVAHPSGGIPTLVRWGREMGKSDHLGVKKRRTASGNEYAFGKIEEIQSVDLKTGVNAVRAVSGIDTGEEIIDIDVAEETLADPSKMSSLDKLRYFLRLQVNDVGFE